MTKEPKLGSGSLDPERPLPPDEFQVPPLDPEKMKLVEARSWEKEEPLPIDDGPLSEW